MAQDYKNTLQMPQTDFSMRAGLPQKEPEILKKWYADKVYEKMLERNEGKPLYILHDGPPYANGKIHLGTALNKCLKDFVIRYKNMSGFKAPYVPGYDTHGLPTELKARKEAGKKSSEQISPLELRKICKDFALRFVDDQKEQFKRLGVLGEWDNPYLTLKPEFVAKQIEIFGEMAEKGYIYKGLKPVYWCPDCQTALAEAEIEYAEDKCHSIYVKFKVKDDMGRFSSMGCDLDNTYFVIWTTTTWTLPGNVAICVGPNYEYSVVKANDEYYVLATELVKPSMQAAGIENYETVGTVMGKDMELMTTYHPFLERESLVIIGDHVTLESGTGCVHTAPGFGVEDFEVCRNYPQLSIVVSIDNKGIQTQEAGQFAGLNTDDANKAIAKHLDENGSLFALQKIIHQYPHCWRCKSPIVYRATEQCFCSIKKFADKAVDAINSVEWIPAWGQDRITNMVKDRSDWCVSRQRTWGVPIPIFYCEDCGEQIINSTTIKHLADIFRVEGADAWYAKDAADLLPQGYTCPKCGKNHFKKETDIMDVWFDSGSTHAAVVDNRDYLRFPADLYLEGADQYRGWFQSSLLTSVATKGVAPYKTIVTHGWVVDGEGKKMSKSIGNTIMPEEIVNQYGADILRLWVASSDYHADIRISKDILKQLSESYRKIRNTARFILGNLYDFNPDNDMIDLSQLESIDKWAIAKLNEVISKAKKGYDEFEYHNVVSAVHNYCVVDLSNFYLDVLKDRLYVQKPDSLSRRAAQTTMYIILDALALLLAPIISFTADEIWSYMPHDKSKNAENIVFNDFPTEIDIDVDEAFMKDWAVMHLVRDDVKKALENARNEKIIGASLEAKVSVNGTNETEQVLKKFANEMADLFITSDAQVSDKEEQFKGDVVSVSVERAEGEKCERCWCYSKDVGSNAKHPDVCAKCAEILG
ncbi:MAG: isoleucine--tRNA ligase [Acutalibacteraceae bacterium]|nr:isoleucine--tRNA ligase [Acutalibacteraceae bacterium]